MTMTLSRRGPLRKSLRKGRENRRRKLAEDFSAYLHASGVGKKDKDDTKEEIHRAAKKGRLPVV